MTLKKEIRWIRFEISGEPRLFVALEALAMGDAAESKHGTPEERLRNWARQRPAEPELGGWGSHPEWSPQRPDPDSAALSKRICDLMEEQRVSGRAIAAEACEKLGGDDLEHGLLLSALEAVAREEVRCRAVNKRHHVQEAMRRLRVEAEWVFAMRWWHRGAPPQQTSPLCRLPRDALRIVVAQVGLYCSPWGKAEELPLNLLEATAKVIHWSLHGGEVRSWNSIDCWFDTCISRQLLQAHRLITHLLVDVGPFVEPEFDIR